MKVNKIFLICLILLAIISIGASSASTDLSLGDDNPSSAQDGVLSVEGWDDDDSSDDEENVDDEEEELSDDAYQIAVNDALSYVYYLDNPAIASLTLPGDAYGNIAAYEGDYESGDYLAEFSLVNGFVEVRLADLNLDGEDMLGNHVFYFVYEGDDYEVYDSEIVLSIVDYELKGPTIIDLGQSATYTLDLHRNITGTIYVTPSVFNGDEYMDGEVVYFDVVNGTSKIVFQDLNMGMYLYRFDFSEDDYTINQEIYLDVCPKLNVKNRVTIGRDDILTVDLPHDASGTFSLSLYSKALDDYTYLNVNYANGNVRFSSIGLTAGDYDIVGYEINDVRYGYLNFENTPTFLSGVGIYTSFKAVNPTGVIVSAANFNTLYTAGGTYKIRVLLDGKPAAGARVVFKINNVKVKATTADKNGYATLKITKNPGKYKIKTVALGKAVTKTLNVKHLLTLKAVTVKQSAGSLTLQASLAKVNGKYLKNKVVTFKFNGKTYKKKSNSKGIAKVTLGSNVLSKLKVGKKITYQATYLKDTVKLSAYVKR